MPTYVTLANWTDQGIKNVKESPSRLDAFKAAADKLGCKVKDFYMVTGRYDMVLITEAPNEEAVAKLTLATGSKGTVRTETLRAYPEAAYREIISELP
jgi:uncharacterized protein with GYD domain